MYACLALIGMSCSEHEAAWTWRLEGRSFGQPQVTGDTVVVATQAGEVVAGDLYSGTKFWQVHLGSAVLSTPAVDEEQVIVATENGMVHSLSLHKSGEELWRIRTGDRFEAPLTVDGDLVYVPSARGVVYCLSRSGGKIQWRFTDGKKYSAAVVRSGPYLLIGGWNGTFHCLRSDGRVQWKFQAWERITEQALVRKNTVFFPAYDGFVYAMDIPTGRLLWRSPAVQPSNLALVGSRLVFTSEKELLAVSPEDGKVHKRIPFSRWVSRVYSNDGECIVVAGSLQAVNLESGEKRTMVPLRESVFKVAFLPEMLVVTGESSSVYGFPR